MNFDGELEGSGRRDYCGDWELGLIKHMYGILKIKIICKRWVNEVLWFWLGFREENYTIIKNSEGLNLWLN